MVLMSRDLNVPAGLLVEVMTGSNAVRMRSLVLRLWSDCVLGGQQRRPLTWAEAVPGNCQMPGDLVNMVTIVYSQREKFWTLFTSLKRIWSLSLRNLRQRSRRKK